MARLITRQEAAKLLDVNQQTISNWIEHGVIKGRNIKKDGATRTYVDKNTIQALFDDAVAINEAKRKIAEMRRETEEEYNKVNFDNLFVKTHPIDTSSTLLIYDLARDVIHFTAEGMLNDRQMQILNDFTRGYSITELADSYKLSRSRICQILARCARVIYQASTFKDIIKKDSELQEKIDELTQAYRYSQNKLKDTTTELLWMRDKYGVPTIMDKTEPVPACEDSELANLIRLFQIKLVDCPLSVRLLNCCRSLDVTTVGDAVQHTPIDFLKARNFGRRSLTELSDFIENLGLRFEMDVEKYFRLWNQQQEEKA